MSNANSKLKNVTCFGEVLWDVLPGNAKAGGAPMNVAYHLHRLGVEANIISRVGQDKRGADLLAILKDWRLSTEFCQLDAAYPTSEVHVKLDSNQEVSYDIVFPVAWDFIEWNEDVSNVVANADVFVFGSLATRNEVSANTLFTLLEKSAYNVFDVNLRAPHYSKDTIFRLLKFTHLLKLNKSELDLLSTWLNAGSLGEDEQIAALQNEFDLDEIIVTRGSKGASYFTRSSVHHQDAFPIDVCDTVGSGDSFLAAFLATKLTRPHAIEDQLTNAAALAAFVSTQEGACPDYAIEDIQFFRK